MSSALSKFLRRSIKLEGSLNSARFLRSFFCFLRLFSARREPVPRLFIVRSSRRDLRKPRLFSVRRVPLVLRVFCNPPKFPKRSDATFSSSSIRQRRNQRRRRRIRTPQNRAVGRSRGESVERRRRASRVRARRNAQIIVQRFARRSVIRRSPSARRVVCRVRSGDRARASR